MELGMQNPAQVMPRLEDGAVKKDGGHAVTVDRKTGKALDMNGKAAMAPWMEQNPKLPGTSCYYPVTAKMHFPGSFPESMILWTLSKPSNRRCPVRLRLCARRWQHGKKLRLRPAAVFRMKGPIRF